VTGISELRLSAMAGRQLPFFSLIVPAWLVWAMAGWRGVIGVWPAIAVAGGSFAIVQFLVSNLHGPWLVDIAAGVVSMVCVVVLLRFWKPKLKWEYSHDGGERPRNDESASITGAWVPWILLCICVFVWGLPQVKAQLQRLTVSFEVPGLHGAIVRTPPVVREPTVEPARFEFAWASATGTGILVAALLSAIWLRIPPRRVVANAFDTLHRLRWPLVTIAAMLALAFTTRYSGLDVALGLAFTHTGRLYPLFAALLGWLGVALTGSDTASNAMFGGLQMITGTRLAEAGVLPLSADQASVLLAAANSTGGVMGKMIDAQSIVVAAAATGHHGHEGAILRSVFWHSLSLAILVGVVVQIQAFWWTAAIP
jgi:lactate permease